MLTIAVSGKTGGMEGGRGPGAYGVREREVFLRRRRSQGVCVRLLSALLTIALSMSSLSQCVYVCVSAYARNNRGADSFTRGRTPTDPSIIFTRACEGPH